MIVVRYKLRCRAGRADAVAAALVDVIGPSRALDGVLSFDIGRDLADPDCFIATEVFEDRAALDRQESLREVGKAMALFDSTLVEEPEATLFEVASQESLAD